MTHFLFWFAAGDHKHFFNFRYQELEALSVLHAVPPPYYAEMPDDPESPYAILNIPRISTAIDIARRSVLTLGVYEIWSHADSIEQCIANLAQLNVFDPQYANPLSQEATFCGRVRAFGKKFSTSQKLEIIHRFFQALPFKGKVDLDQPQYEFWVLLDYGPAQNKSEQPLKRVFFSRRLAKSSREPLLAKYALNARDYIGTTSTKAELAFLMANQVLAQPGTLIYDPFMGTGSIMVSCAAFGSSVIGSDIDIRVLHGNEKTIFDNFKQYNLPRPEVIRSDASRPVWRSGFQFDGIACDPPYGIREGARKSGTNKEVKEILEEHRDSYIPRTQLYDVANLMSDLLDFAARSLKMGGRLVYLLPTNDEYCDKDIPQHPCLELVGNSEQYLSTKLRRRLITMEKTREHHDGIRSLELEHIPSHAKVKNYFHKRPDEPTVSKKSKPNISPERKME